MDSVMGIARYSMQMSAVKTNNDVQIAMMKNVMDVQKATMEGLLASLGLGANMNVQA